MTTLKVTITNAEGEIYCVALRDEWGKWIEDDGDVLAESDREFAGDSRTTMHDLLTSALRWIDKDI